MTNVNSTSSTQPSSPNKSQSYTEYMMTLKSKLACISNSGPVSPQSPLEYSPALSPTQRRLVGQKDGVDSAEAPVSEGPEGVPAGPGEAEGGTHADRLAHLDHELSKISLHYKHAAPKDTFSEHVTEELLAAAISDVGATYEDKRGARFHVSRAAPLRNYALCRLLPNHGKEKLDLSQGQFASDNALDELSCDNTSLCEDVGEGGDQDARRDGEGEGEADGVGDVADEPGDDCDTYVLTDRTRARCYVLEDVLAERRHVILDPAPRSETTLSPGEACEERDRSYLIVDPARDVTCTVLSRTLALDDDAAFAPFREERHRPAPAPAPAAAQRAPVSEELARWRAAAEGEAGGGVSAGPAPPRRFCARAQDLAADLWVEDTLTDKVSWRQVVVVALSPAGS